MKLEGYWLVMITEVGRSKEVLRNCHDVVIGPEGESCIQFTAPNGTIHFSNATWHLRSEKAIPQAPGISSEPESPVARSGRLTGAGASAESGGQS